MLSPVGLAPTAAKTASAISVGVIHCLDIDVSITHLADFRLEQDFGLDTSVHHDYSKCSKNITSKQPGSFQATH